MGDLERGGRKGDENVGVRCRARSEESGFEGRVRRGAAMDEKSLS